MSNLVIVESPSKASTVKGYLGPNYKVIASVGHVRDLPKSTLSVDVENGFEAHYINIRGKGDLIKELKKEAKAAAGGAALPQTVEVQVNGVSYKVTVGEAGSMPAASAAPAAAAAGTGEGKELAAPLEGKFYLVKAQGEPAVKVGDVVKAGQTVCYIEAMKTFNAIAAECDGVITEICAENGQVVEYGQPLFYIA